MKCIDYDITRERSRFLREVTKKESAVIRKKKLSCNFLATSFIVNKIVNNSDILFVYKILSLLKYIYEILNIMFIITILLFN